MPSLSNLSALAGWRQRTQRSLGMERIWDPEPASRGWTNEFLLLSRMLQFASVVDGLMAANSFPHSIHNTTLLCLQKGKTISSLLSLCQLKEKLCFSIFYYTHTNTSPLTPDVCFFPHKAILQFSVDTNCMSYNSIKF